MKIYLSLFSLVTLFLYVSCQCETTKKTSVNPQNTTVVKDYNVLIVPDLSNRINTNLYPKPVHDTVLINHTLSRAKIICGLGHRKTGQKDIYRLDFINKGILTKQVVNTAEVAINLRQFDNNMVARANYLRYHLMTDAAKFKGNVCAIYEHAEQHPAGADVWNYFNETVRASLLNVAKDTVLKTDENIVVKENRNVAILLTDGYIESANKGGGYLLNGETLNAIRKEYNASGSASLEEFIYSNPAYFINKTAQSLAGMDVLVCEVLDRSLDKNGAARVQPTDFQIMDVLWRKWLGDSGCGKVKIVQAVKSKEEFSNEVESFLQSL